MKCIVFDSGPVISFALNNLLWLFPELKQHYSGEFVIPPQVKEEIVDRPLEIRRFKFEAFQVMELFENGVFSAIDAKGLTELSGRIFGLANRIFWAKGSPIRILHMGESQVLAIGKLLKADASVIDERTTRLLIENPKALLSILASKLHTKVKCDRKALREFNNMVGEIRIIRSVELVTVGYELGLLDRYFSDSAKIPKSAVLEASLWALKLKGATVSQMEIEKIVKIAKS
jgi:hypothetical protein